MKISRAHRDPLREAVLVDLIDLDDVGTFIGRKRMTEARGYRDRFERDMRLLDDLGWEELDDRESFELTMPAVELESLVGYLREIAETQLHHWSEDLAAARDPEMTAAQLAELNTSVRAHVDLDLDTMAACAAVLSCLHRRNGRSNGPTPRSDGVTPRSNGSGATVGSKGARPQSEDLAARPGLHT
jgi:hypothetical protein